MAQASPETSTRTQAPQPSRPALLWFIRHAEVEAAYQSVFGGRIDMNLSPRGHEQAAALAEYLRGKSFDSLYCSPMRRVQQTLAPLLNDSLPEPETMADLREVDFGAWTGLAWGDVERKFGISPFLWLHQLECNGIPEAECASALRKRVEPCLKQILQNTAGKQIAVLCHGGVIRMALSILLGLPLTSMAVVEIEYASITQVSWTPTRPRLELLNFTPWRDLPV